MHPSHNSTTISVLSAADDGYHNVEDNIEDREEENKKPTDNNDSRRDYRVGHCCVHRHRQLKCLRCSTTLKVRLDTEGVLTKQLQCTDWMYEVLHGLSRMIDLRRHFFNTMSKE